MSFDLSDYVDVRHRLEQALQKHPQLTVVETRPALIHIGERTYIECAVTVYRTPDDPQPVHAYCWEVWPGRTPYTKDSEQPNGATSALGRALGYMGFGIGRAIASANEVRTAQGNTHPATEPRPKADNPRPMQGMATGRQIELIGKMRDERGIEPWNPTNKTYADASDEITRLKAIPRD